MSVVEPCSFSRVRSIPENARALRRDIVRRGAELPELDRVHFYPRSVSYEVDGSNAATGTHIIMYGSDSRGQTVAARVTGFAPYLFVRARTATADEIEAFVAQLNDVLVVATMQRENGAIRSQVRRLVGIERARPVRGYTIVTGTALKASGPDSGFNGTREDRFVRIEFYAPAYLRVTLNLLEHATQATAPVIATYADAIAYIVAGVAGSPRLSNAPTTEPPRKRLKPTEQRYVDAAKGTRTFDRAVSARRAAVDDDDDDDETGNPWNDPTIDVTYDDDAAPEPAAAVAETLSPLVCKALSAIGARARATSLAATLRLGEVFEGDLDFTLRYLIDAGFAPEECVVLTRDNNAKVLRRERDGTVNDVQIVVDWHELVRHDDERFQATVPPQVCLSFDCEMELASDGGFPRAETERVLQICCTIFDPVADPAATTARRCAFVLESVALPSAEEQRARQQFVLEADEVYVFTSETRMLLAFSAFVRALQPDMSTGYNVEGFDFTYLLNRARRLGVHDEFAMMCRSETGLLRSQERSFSSRAHGTHVYREIAGDGMFVFDLFQAFKRSTQYKLRSYTLEYVSMKFLDDRKDDVSYSAINRLQTTPEGRYTLMHYCIKDAMLPARLIGKLAMLLDNIVMSRLTGVPIDMVVRRGLQVRLDSLLFRAARYDEPRRLFYTRTAADRADVGESYAGGYVAKPVVGFHDVPVATLDFRSLYPSIMKTFNVCISTFMLGSSVAAALDTLTLDDLWLVAKGALPGGDEAQPVFVRESHTLGLIPRIITRLLDERTAVRELIPTESDSFKRSLLNAKQLNLKLQANSLYGFLGSVSSKGSCQPAAAFVTAMGRAIIKETKVIVEAEYTRARGYNFDANVVYGDTDSVFVKFVAAPALTIEECARWGQHMAAFVTRHFQAKFGVRPGNLMHIEFEKIFSKIIFYAKKRYVGRKYVLEKGVLVRKAKPSASGMETERRDSCLIVSEAVAHVIELLLDDTTNREQALTRVRTYLAHEVIGRLEAGTVPWNKLIQSKQFRKRLAEYSGGQAAPPIHVQLVEKLERRRAATQKGPVYSPGDRPTYVVIEETKPGQNSSECGEDPDYAWENGLRLSLKHYVYNGVHKTMSRVLDPVLYVAPATRTFGDDDDDDESTKKESATKAERRFATFIAGAPRKRIRLDNDKRCALCDVPSETPLCTGAHTAEERAAFAAELTAHTSALVKERVTCGRTCMACKQGWLAEKDEARALALPSLPAGDIEQALPCPIVTCDTYWQRRMVDRRAARI
jgi:DNA polymerase elongation subunit (family B)